jgi:hypothetical protein
MTSKAKRTKHQSTTIAALQARSMAASKRPVTLRDLSKPAPERSEPEKSK